MRRVITSLQDAYKLIKHGEDVILIYEVPSKCEEIVIRKTRFVPFAREQYLRILLIPDSMGSVPPINSEDYRNYVTIPIYQAGEVAAEIIESGWKNCTVIIGGERVDFKFDPSITDYNQLITFESA